MSATPRLFVQADLSAGAEVVLDTDQSHYLTRVMRLEAGDSVRLFNGRDGEFDASIASAGKSAAKLALGAQTRVQVSGPDLWLLFAPLKKTRTDFVVEKAVELGAADIRPVITDRCEAETVRTERLQRIAVEAAEQTERLDVPPVREAMGLYAMLDGWDAGRRLYFCDEAGEEGEKPWGGEAGRAPALFDVLKGDAGGQAAVLIGPEGGFTPAERGRLRGLPFVRAVGLGPRILRAETAAIAALSIWQAAAGDWR
jgi:16S rRNA (uracil1498-N3)-methyltransferase